ncbi:MAG: PAS domain S-box protein [Pseudomonadota bacterium]
MFKMIKTERKIIIIAVVLAILMWLADTLVDYFFFHKKSFFQVLAGSISPHDFYLRSLLVLSIFLFAAIIISRTFRSRAEAAIQLSDERFRSLVETMSDWIWEVDQNGVYTYASPRVKDLLGYEPKEVIGKTPFDLMPADEAKRIREMFKDLVATEAPFEKLENINLRKDGRPIVLETSGVPIIDKSGKLVGYRGIDRDITDRKQAENALKESESKWRSLTEHSPDIILNVDHDSKIQFVNHTVSGLTPEKTIGRSIYDFMPPKYHKLVKNKFEETFRTGHSTAYESEGLGPDGTISWYSCRIEPIKSDFRVHSVNLITTDITEKKREQEQRKELEARLGQAQKMETVGTLAGGIAHDLNNILTPMFLHGELVMDELPKNSKAYEHQERVMNAVNNARDLVKRLLAFSSRKKATDYKPLKIKQVVKEALDFIRSTLPPTIEIRFHIERDCGTVSADPIQIQQVVMNLCTNACHAMQEKGGIINVEVSAVDLDEEFVQAYPRMHAGTHIKLSVTDIGIGMDQSTMKRMFEPFFTTRKEDEGSGLGLFVAYGIVESYAGTITVESELGKGSTFHVYLPCT